MYQYSANERWRQVNGMGERPNTTLAKHAIDFAVDSVSTLAVLLRHIWLNHFAVQSTTENVVRNDVSTSRTRTTKAKTASKHMQHISRTVKFFRLRTSKSTSLKSD